MAGWFMCGMDSLYEVSMGKKILIFILQVAATISLGFFLVFGFGVGTSIFFHHDVYVNQIVVTLFCLAAGLGFNKLANKLKQSDRGNGDSGTKLAQRLNTPWKRFFFLITFVLLVLWVISLFYVKFRWGYIERFYIYGAYKGHYPVSERFYYGLFSWVWYLFPLSLFLLFFGEKLLRWIKKG